MDWLNTECCWSFIQFTLKLGECMEFPAPSMKRTSERDHVLRDSNRISWHMYSSPTKIKTRAAPSFQSALTGKGLREDKRWRAPVDEGDWWTSCLTCLCIDFPGHWEDRDNLDGLCGCPCSSPSKRLHIEYQLSPHRGHHWSPSIP